MKRTLSVCMMCLLLSLPVMAADESASVDPVAQDFGRDMVEKCLEMKHGEMLRCIEKASTASPKTKLQSGIRTRR